MLSFLPPPVTGVISILIYALNTLFWCIPLFAVAIIKFAFQSDGVRKICDALLLEISLSWIFINNLNQKLTQTTTWNVTGLEKLKKDDWYLVISNHQSWVDIVVLQRIFYRKIPFLKFFLKKELIWVPILGLAWWALDFPFMQRYKKEFLEKNPHLKGRDLEITRKACEKFKTMPISVMNFIEGTRFSEQKHTKQESPYKHLLKPKAGGIAFVLSAMDGVVSKIINVTIAYPKGVKTFWEFACGKLEEVKVDVEVLPISAELKGDYSEDAAFRETFHHWLNEFWLMKDKKIERMLSE